MNSSSFEAGAGSSKTRRVVVGFLRLAISVAFLWLILWKVGAQDTLARMKSLSAATVLAAAALLVATFAFHARRWQIVLGSLGHRWSFAVALRETWIGYFFTQLLPSSIGGDGVRALRLYRTGAGAGTALRSVIAERIFGLVACVLLSIAAVPIMLAAAPAGIGTLIVEITTLAGLAAILVLFRPQVVGFLMPRRFAAELYGLSAMFRQEAHPVRVMLISLAMQLTVAAAVGLLAWGMGARANPWLVAALFQPVTLVSIIPISVAGWGVREGASIAIFGAAGIASADALPVSLAFGAILLVTSLPGWALFALAPAQRNLR